MGTQSQGMEPLTTGIKEDYCKGQSSLSTSLQAHRALCPQAKIPGL